MRNFYNKKQCASLLLALLVLSMLCDAALQAQDFETNPL